MFFFASLIILVEVLIFLTNYLPHTFLMGWDNIMPELDLGINLERSLFGVWQENRGLGFFDGMSHVANLFHTMFISIISFATNQSLSRYVFLSLTHLFGGIAFFYLAYYLTKNKKTSLIGSLFYMFNLGVIQMYFTPLEAFAMHFTALPALALSTTKTLHNPNKKNLIFLLIMLLLVTPQSFVTTLFLSSSLLFLSILLFFYLTEKKLKPVLVILTIFLSANAFWLFPYIPSSIQNAKIIKNTRINEFSSEEIYSMNKKHGDLLSLVNLKGFMIDSIAYDHKKGSDVYIMEPWIKYSEKTLYRFSSFFIFGISGIGIFTVLKHKNKKLLPYIVPFFISFFFLANNTLFIEQFNNLLRGIFPIINEAFRFPFTKFITLFAFCLSIFLTIGLSYLSLRMKRVGAILIVFTFSVVIYMSLPAFKGNFFSPLLKLKMPNEYFLVFDYFKKIRQDQRIALLPTHTFWNWQYRDWGQFGSGFIWYGIKQPMLERAFDPWSNYNEQFYNELSYAIKRKDIKRFNQTIEKYDISYLLLDAHIIAKEGGKINYSELKDFLINNSYLERKSVFGKLEIYKTKAKNEFVYSLDKEQTITAYPNFTNENEDFIYDIYPSNYIIDESNPDVAPLLPSLYTEKLQQDLEFSFDNKNDSISFFPNKKVKLSGNKKHFLVASSLFNNEFLVPMEIEINKNIVLKPIYPLIKINGKKININEKPFILEPKVVKTPKKIILKDIYNREVDLLQQEKAYLISGLTNSIILENENQKEVIELNTSRDSEKFFIELPQENITSIEVEIPKIKSPIYAIEKNIYKKVLKAKNEQKEYSFYIDGLYHQQSYVFIIKALYKSGLPAVFYLDNTSQEKGEMEIRLSKNKVDQIVVIPSMENYFKGYGFHFIAKSVGNEISEVELEETEIYPLPLNTLRSIYISSPDSKLFLSQNINSLSQKTPATYTKINSSLYEVVPSHKKNQYLVLSQSFDKNWKAYQVESGKMKNISHLSSLFPFLFGKEIKEHVLVNNWANGWLINNSQLPASPAGGSTLNSQFVIIFWPQYLEYLGFLFLLGTFVFILFKYKNEKI